MLTIVIRGGDEARELAMVERPDPEPDADEVLVRVSASALNRADLLQLRGLYPAPPGAPPDVPGLELAGIVETCGARVRGIAAGDRVMAVVAGGGHAARIAVDHRLCMPVPERLELRDAAAIPEAFLTAYDALLEQAELTCGETVLVHAAGSGVGTAAVQIAAAAGARVVALSRDSAKRTRLEQMGVERAFDAADPQLAARLAEFAPQGVQVVLDLVGGEGLAFDLGALSERGRVLLVGLLAGRRATIDLGTMLARRARVTGTVLRGRSLAEKATLVERFAKRMLPLFDAGRLVPVVDRTYAAADVSQACHRMESNANFGKIVLDWAGAAS